MYACIRKFVRGANIMPSFVNIAHIIIVPKSHWVHIRLPCSWGLYCLYYMYNIMEKLIFMFVLISVCASLLYVLVLPCYNKAPNSAGL